MLRTLSFMIILGLMVSAVGAQAEIPASIDGQAVYVPFPVAITVDGDLSDWSDIPFVTVNRGTMTSDDPAENGSFSFAVAADADNFYITMTMPDKNIIAGQHGTDFWNEDSLEFYLNLTDNLSRKDYVDGVAQFNINAAAIDNSDPTAITVTGTNANSMDVQAIVFTTDDGWGFEAAVPFDGRITPAHGLEIGFQAQVNGATEADRDVKLIWSLADTADNSWQDPSLFGSAIFFELGQTEVPMPADRTIAEAPTPTPAPGMEARVAVNEVGYFVKGPKLAMLASDSSEPVHWSLIDTDSGDGGV